MKTRWLIAATLWLLFSLSGHAAEFEITWLPITNMTLCDTPEDVSGIADWYSRNPKAKEIVWEENPGCKPMEVPEVFKEIGAIPTYITYVTEYENAEWTIAIVQYFFVASSVNAKFQDRYSFVIMEYRPTEPI